jgi:hypothetical protein
MTEILAAHLGDLQDLLVHARQVLALARGADRRGDRALLSAYYSVLSDQGVTILAFSAIGIAGSYGVAWFGIRINTYANSRTAFASLAGNPHPVYAIRCVRA